MSSMVLIQNTRDQWTLFSKFFKKSKLVAEVIQQRATIVQFLDDANRDYKKILELDFNL